MFLNLKLYFKRFRFNEYMGLNINLSFSDVEEGIHSKMKQVECFTECEINKQSYFNIHNPTIEDDQGEEERKSSYYCCYQNIPFCCESDINLYTSEQSVNNKERCTQNAYENIMLTSGN